MPGFKVVKMQIREERTHGRKTVVRKEAKRKKKVAGEKTEHVGLVVKQDTLQRGVERAADEHLYAIDEDESEKH